MTLDEAIAWVNAAPTGEERAWRKHMTFHIRYPARGLPIHALDTPEKAKARLDEYYRLFPEARKYLEGKL